MTTLTNRLFDLYLKKGYKGNKKEIAAIRQERINQWKTHATQQTKLETDEKG